MNKLPKPKDKLGYTEEEIIDICDKLEIDADIFWIAFGINTVAIGKDGKSRYYFCDVEKALYELGNKLGKFHIWD